MRAEGAARLGEPRPPAQAIEQRRAQLLLEQAEAAADRRLRAVQARAGAGEAAELGDGDEGSQAVNIHRSVFLMLMANTMHSTEDCLAAILP